MLYPTLRFLIPVLSLSSFSNLKTKSFPPFLRSFNSSSSLLYPSFIKYPSLTDIGGFTDIGLNYPSATLFLGLCPNLSNQSVQNILDGLYSRDGAANTSYVTFHNNVYNNITEDQFALAASKNWIIGSYPND